MMLSSDWLLVMLVSVTVSVNPVQSMQCSPPSTQTKVAIDSQRNKTGKWESHVNISSLASKAGQERVLVEVDIQTIKCGDNDTYENILLTIKGPPAQMSHPPSYELFPGVGYYKFHTATPTWAAARQICAEEGGHLAIVNSDEEAESLKALFARFPANTITGGTWTNYAWIGIHDLNVEGKFETIFGVALASTGYSRWNSGEPESSADNTEDCVEFHRTGVWYDTPCHHKVAFICEDELE